MGSSLTQAPSLHQVWFKSVHHFLYNLANKFAKKQANQQNIDTGEK